MEKQYSEQSQEDEEVVDREGEKTHDEVLRQIGGLGLRASLILIPAKVSGDLIVNIAAFYQLMPKFECQKAEGDWSTCTQSDFCENMGAPAGVAHRNNISDPETLQNWVQQLGMECSEKAAFGLLGTLIFTGWTAAAFIIPRLSDLYGRKWIFVSNMLVQLLAIITVIAAKSYITMAIGLFMVGVCSSARWTVSYVFLMEFLTEKNVKNIGPFVNASAALAFVIGAFTLQFLTKETVVLEYTATVISLLSPLLTVLFLPESPKWLVGQGRMEEAKEAYAYIAKANGQKTFAQELQGWTFQKETAQEEKQSSQVQQSINGESEPLLAGVDEKVYEGKVWELWQYRTLRFNLFVLIVCWCSTSFGFYMLAYVLKYLNGNIFLNAYSSSAGEIIGKLSTIPLLRYTSLRRVYLVAFSFASIGSLLLAIFSQSDAWIPLMLLVARFGFAQGFVAGYLSLVLLYPTILTSTAMGICVTLSKIATIFAPMIAEVRSPVNLCILLGMALLSLTVSQCLILLPEKAAAKRDGTSKRL